MATSLNSLSSYPNIPQATQLALHNANLLHDPKKDGIIMALRAWLCLLFPIVSIVLAFSFFFKKDFFIQFRNSLLLDKKSICELINKDSNPTQKAADVITLCQQTSTPFLGRKDIEFHLDIYDEDARAIEISSVTNNQAKKVDMYSSTDSTMSGMSDAPIRY